MFICPVCGESLFVKGNSLYCGNSHCFDISKQGYVNLLQNRSQKEKRHGDDKLMTLSRTAFLDGGFYQSLLMLISSIASSAAGENIALLDAGCGDCYYSLGVRAALSPRKVDIYGIDISRDALITASKRSKDINTAVASASKLPFKDGVFDVVLNIFAPDSAELSRVLRNGALLIKVIPDKRHLFSLKAAVYDSPYENTVIIPALPGLDIIDTRDLAYTIDLRGEEIKHLFRMTPYFYKTGAADQTKLDVLEELCCECAFKVITYKKTKV